MKINPLHLSLFYIPNIEYHPIDDPKRLKENIYIYEIFVFPINKEKIFQFIIGGSIKRGKGNLSGNKLVTSKFARKC